MQGFFLKWQVTLETLKRENHKRKSFKHTDSGSGRFKRSIKKVAMKKGQKKKKRGYTHTPLIKAKPVKKV